jgi:hypothetical protein
MQQSTPSCAARLLDIRTYVLAARRSMLNAEPAAALFMMLTFGLIALCLLPLWLTFDLGSTWDFTTGLRDAAAPAVAQMTAQADSWLQLSIGAALAGLILTSFTLLPSLFELAFPSVQHPLLSLVLLVSIVFDFITDWSKASELVATWTSNPILHFLFTAGACAFFSVGAQALLIVCLTVMIFGVLALLRGGGRKVEAVVINQ